MNHRLLLIRLVAIVLLYALATSHAQEIKMTPNAVPTDHEPARNSTIQDLTRERNGLQSSLDTWNSVYIWALALTVLVGVAAAITQFKTIALAKSLVAVQSRIEREADRQLQKDLEGRDVKIAELNNAAVALNKEIAGAQQRIAEANRAASEATARAAEANLELAKFKAPRNLAPEQRDRIATRLKAFSGQQFTLGVSSHPEAVALMRAIEDTLTDAGWAWAKPIGVITMGEKADLTIDTGVTVQVSAKTTSLIDTAASALTSALVSEGIQTRAERNTYVDSDHAAVIRVVVGSKP